MRGLSVPDGSSGAGFLSRVLSVRRSDRHAWRVQHGAAARRKRDLLYCQAMAGMLE